MLLLHSSLTKNLSLLTDFNTILFITRVGVLIGPVCIVSCIKAAPTVYMYRE